MEEKKLKNKILYTAQVYNESVSNHTVNFVSKEVFNNFKDAPFKLELFEKKDVLSAVEYLKNSFEYNQIRLTDMTPEDIMEKIKEAFPDLY